MARGGSDLEDLSQSVGACPVCRSVRYRPTDAGVWVCEHGHQSQSIWTQDHAEDGPGDDGGAEGTSRTVRRQLSQGRARRRRVLRTTVDLATQSASSVPGPLDGVLGDRAAYAVLVALQSVLRAQLAAVCAAWPGVHRLCEGREAADTEAGGARRSARRAGRGASSGGAAGNSSSHLAAEGHGGAENGPRTRGEGASPGAPSRAAAAAHYAVSPGHVPASLEHRCRTLWLALVSSVGVAVEFVPEEDEELDFSLSPTSQSLSQVLFGDQDSVPSADAGAMRLSPRHVLAVLFLGLLGEGMPLVLADLHGLVASRVLPYNDCGPYHDGDGTASAGSDAWLLPPGVLDALRVAGYRGLARRGTPPALDGLERVVHAVAARLALRLGGEALFCVPDPMVHALRLCSDLLLPPVYASVALHVFGTAGASASYASATSPSSALCAAFFSSLCVLYDLGQRDAGIPALIAGLPRRGTAPGGMPLLSELLAHWAQRLAVLAPIAAAACGASESTALAEGALAVASEITCTVEWSAAREAVAVAGAAAAHALSARTLLPPSRAVDYFSQSLESPRWTATQPTAPALRAILAEVARRRVGHVFWVRGDEPKGSGAAEDAALPAIPVAQRTLLLLIAAVAGVPPRETVRLAWRLYSA